MPEKLDKLKALAATLSDRITEARKLTNEIAETSLGLADDESVQQLRRNLLDAARAEGRLSAKIDPDRGGSSPSPAYGRANYGEGNYGETEAESAPSPRPADSPADPYGNYGDASPAGNPTPYSG